MENNLLRQQVLAAKNGDKEAKEIILRKFTPLLIKNIIKYFGKNQDFYDLLQEGRVVILQSIRDFDENLGVPFPGYVKRQIFYHYINERKKIREYLILDQPLNDGGFCLMDRLIKEERRLEEDYLSKVEKELLYIGLEKLTPKQKEIILDYYFKGKTLKSIAEKKGLSYQSIIKLKARALKRLQKEIV